MNAANIYKDKEVSGTKKWIEEGSNAFGTFAPFPWNVAHVGGWEGGRAISQNDWYRANVRPLIQDALGVDRDEYPKLSYNIGGLNLGTSKNQ